MTADEMFEKLGYVEQSETQWGGIKYKKDDDNVLYFYIEDREIDKDGEYDSMCEAITMAELQAINQKCKELGWLE